MFASFWAYTTPLVGAYIADTYFGRLKTIQYAIRFALVGHCILIVSALPFMIQRPHMALIVFIIGLIVLGMLFRSSSGTILISHRMRDWWLQI